MIFRCLGWIYKLTVDRRSPAAQTSKVRVRGIPPMGEKEAKVVGPGYSQAAPCINGCIGGPPMRYPRGRLPMN